MILILSIVAILIDQLSKFAAVKYLKGQGAYKIIDNFFHLYYVENRGAAFGILQNRRMLFLVITTLIIIGIIIALYKNYNKLNNFTKVAFGLLIGGAVGNLIDRIRLEYVIDFISFKLFNGYNFPVFNIADICIVIGTFMVMILVILDDSGRWC